MKIEIENYCTVKQASELLKVTMATIYNYCTAAKIKFIGVGSVRLIEKDSLITMQEFLDRRERAGGVK